MTCAVEGAVERSSALGSAHACQCRDRDVGVDKLRCDLLRPETSISSGIPRMVPLRQMQRQRSLRRM
jgi:hypothetical protein